MTMTNDTSWYSHVAVPVLVLLFAKPVMEFCRRSAYWGRPKRPEDEVFRLFGGGERVEAALRFLAKTYDVPLGFLRPDDVFTKEGPLWKYDSWTESGGQEDLGDYLVAHGKTDIPQTWTLRDFVQWYVESEQTGQDAEPQEERCRA